MFPACEKCNSAASQIEQAVALYFMLANHEEIDPDTTQLRKLLRGVSNNNPDLMPSMTRSANEARQHFKKRGLSLDSGRTYKDIPLLKLPVANKRAMEFFSRRLTCALYYKEVGHPLPSAWRMVNVWTHLIDPIAVDLAAAAREMFPQVEVTTRRNTTLGEQFIYRWGCNEDRTIFGFAAQFSRSFLFVGAAAAPQHVQEARAEAWRPHSDDIISRDELLAAKHKRYA